MKYEIINESGKKKVKFYEENGEHIVDKVRDVKTDKYGHEYVRVPNPKNPKHINMFTGRIKDAVEQIRFGIGDCIISNGGISFGSRIDSVALFLDREYGDKIKNQSIDGWKNAEFGYAIEGYFKHSMGGPVKYTEDGELWNDWFPELNKKPFVSFSLEEEANELIQKWTKMAIEADKNYRALDAIEDKNSEEANKIREYTRSLPFVVLDLASNYADDYDGNDFVLEVVQLLKSNKE